MKKPGGFDRADEGEDAPSSRLEEISKPQTPNPKAEESREDKVPKVGPSEFKNWSLPALLLLTFGCLLLFLRKPFFIDDTLFLRVAEQIQRHPTDFFGSSMNWGHTTTPMSEVFDNPPLACYYLAAAASVVGWSEPALHLAFVLPALAAIWGIFVLAKRHCHNPALAAALALVSPVFLISASTVMCDVLMLALWVWAVVLFDRGVRTTEMEVRNPPRSFLIPLESRYRGKVGKSGVGFLFSGILAGLAYLTKFPALALVPLFLAYGFFKRRRVGWWLIAPLVPLVVAGGYEWLTYRLYGHGHLLQAATYSHEQNASLGLGDRLVLGAGFAGACFLPVLFYAPLLWRRQVL